MYLNYSVYVCLILPHGSWITSLSGWSTKHVSLSKFLKSVIIWRRSGQKFWWHVFHGSPCSSYIQHVALCVWCLAQAFHSRGTFCRWRRRSWSGCFASTLTSTISTATTCDDWTRKRTSTRRSNTSSSSLKSSAWLTRRNWRRCKIWLTCWTPRTSDDDITDPLITGF